jgi:hypothetical protein
MLTCINIAESVMKEIITKLPKSGEGNEYSDPQNQRAMKRLNIKRSLMSHTD